MMFLILSMLAVCLVNFWMVLFFVLLVVGWLAECVV